MVSKTKQIKEICQRLSIMTGKEHAFHKEGPWYCVETPLANETISTFGPDALISALELECEFHENVI